MSDDWDQIRGLWESIREGVGDGRPPPAASAAVSRGGPKLSGNPVSITGEAGAGKTVLCGALLQAIRSGDPDSRKSPDIEKHKAVIRAGGRRTQTAVTVIPGQLSLEREQALTDTMRGEASPHGIIHVTCWGHNRIWLRSDGRDVRDELAAAGGPVDEEAVRAWHLEKESLDFRVLADAIIDGELAKRLRWLLVVVSKCDLYWDRLDEARDHYIPGGAPTDSRFAASLRDLRSQTSLRLGVLPMASRLIRHEFLPGIDDGVSRLDDSQIGVLRGHFNHHLQRFIASDGGGSHGAS
ncbi:hypothetical protein ACF09C_03245 [Streptomyces sp. NPDC014870]|uniref:hypothetical protein n=1 Tax=Streptomyces sp. NPDC014870 TaxID=3364925 RepID=UPI0036FB4CC8